MTYKTYTFFDAPNVSIDARSTFAAGNAMVVVAFVEDFDAVISGGRCYIRCCGKYYEESEGRETHGCSSWSIGSCTVVEIV